MVNSCFEHGKERLVTNLAQIFHEEAAELMLWVGAVECSEAVNEVVTITTGWW